MLHPLDTVAVCRRDVAAGEWLVADGGLIALRRHGAGDPVIKYGRPIGVATRAIEPGEHVHTHNLATVRGRRGRPAPA
jgi:altronate hydrolase